MDNQKGNVRRNIAQLAKKQLHTLINENLKVRADYLYAAHSKPNTEIFTPEDMAQYLLKNLITRQYLLPFHTVMPEWFLSFLSGECGEQRNVIEVAIRTNYIEEFKSSLEEEWDKYYLLHLLPNKNLCFLLSVAEKFRASLLLAGLRENHIDRTTEYNTNSYKSKSLPPIAEKFTGEAIKRFIRLGQTKPVCQSRPFAITIFGFHRALMGIGEDARTLYDNLTMLGFRVELVNCCYDEMLRADSSQYYELFETKSAMAEVAIFCMPLFEMARIISSLDSKFFEDRYTIGYWPWELTSFQNGWGKIADLVDEIWASSNFLVSVFQKEFQRPVFKIPLDVVSKHTFQSPSSVNPRSNSSDYILTVLDLNSNLSRKNPIGAIVAFLDAFPNLHSNERLIIKTINGAQNADAIKKIMDAIGSDKRISIHDGAVSDQELIRLMRNAKIFLSLHRSEGFGRLVAEAMLQGVPVIATDWSGTQDFVLPCHAYPVRCNLVPVEPTEYPFAAGLWAEPDLTHAAELLKIVSSHPAELKWRTDSAEKFVRLHFGPDAIQSLLLEKLEEIDIFYENNQ